METDLMAEADITDEYRKLAMVLWAIAAANNSGYSTIIPSYEERPSSLSDILDRDTEVSEKEAASELGILYVRNKEIVATSSMIQRTKEAEGKGFGLPPGIIVFRNASSKPDIFEPNLLVTVIETGQSHWPKISKLIRSSDILDPEILR
jgi:hypothetical protein